MKKTLTMLAIFLMATITYAQPADSAPTPMYPQADVVSLFSDAYTDIAVTTWSATWDAADHEFIEVAGDSVLKWTNFVFSGTEGFKVDATNLTHFTVDIYTDDDVTTADAFKIKLVDYGADGLFGGGDDVEHELTFNSSTYPGLKSGAWNTITIALDDFTNMTTRAAISQMIFSGSISTVYMDNIFFGKPADGTVLVKFSVDMSVQIAEGNFVLGSSDITVTGDWLEDAGAEAGSNWGTGWTLSDANGDSIFVEYAALPADSVGKEYAYKYRMNAGWEGITGDRMFTLESTAMVLPTVYYSDDDVVDLLPANKFIFAADLTDIAGTGAGFFDPESDEIRVKGLDWDGLGTRLPGNEESAMTRDLFAAGFIYRDTIEVRQAAGFDSTKWKYKTDPGNKFQNDGWETGDDRWVTYGADGAEINTGEIVPRIAALGGPLGQSQDVNFKVNLNTVAPGNAQDDGSPIPLDDIFFIGLKGSAPTLGSWVGDWTPADTLAGNMLVMHDDGMMGDASAGDNIWTRTVTFPDTIARGNVQYKYGAHYDGNPLSSSPMDNAAGFGDDYVFDLQPQTGVIEIDDVWKSEATTGPTGPQVKAPTPTTPAAQVISLFSEAYDDVEMMYWDATWDVADYSQIAVEGDSVKKWDNLSYAGTEVQNTIDATNMTHFNMDVWIAVGDGIVDPASFKIKLVDYGANGVWNGAGQVDDVEDELPFNDVSTPAITGGQWSTLSIPLDDFANMTTRGHIAQLIISGDPNTVYVDNIYFSGPAATEIDVNFKVDMSVQIAEGNFVAATDTVTVTGDWVIDAGGTDNWGDNGFAGHMLTQVGATSVYEYTATFDPSSVGNTYNFKFRSKGGWEADPTRTFTLEAANMMLPVDYYNRDSVVNVIVTNHFEFAADLTDIAGTGAGFFDPSTDQIQVMGLDWDGLGTRDPSDPYRDMKQDLFASGVVYRDTITASGPLGDSTKWKYKAFPDSKFANTGWETGGDRWDTFIADGSTINTGLIVPRISALGGPLGQEQDVRFKVNLNTKAPGNAADDGSPIPLDEIAFIGLKGAAEELGAWAGDWTAADTTAGNMLGMHDDGAFGDATAGDNIWTRIVTFADTTARGVVEYKYGAEYTSNPLSSAPLDNCGGFGINYSVDVQPTSGIIELDDEWLTAAGPVGIERLDEFMPSDYELSQNYPNPFNPTTVIRYSIPEAAHVRVTVHNLIGEIVATLVDGEQSASFYEVSFDASKLSSGLYFYTIQAGKFVSTKKMMLMK